MLFYLTRCITAPTKRQQQQEGRMYLIAYTLSKLIGKVDLTGLEEQPVYTIHCYIIRILSHEQWILKDSVER